MSVWRRLRPWLAVVGRWLWVPVSTWRRRWQWLAGWWPQQWPARAYRWVTFRAGERRASFVPVGIAAMVAMGVHVASEVMVSGTFVALGGLDRAAEALCEVSLRAIGWVASAEEGWVERNTYAFAASIDIDTREAWSRWLGVAVEIFVDVFLVRAALGYEVPPPPRRRRKQPALDERIETMRARLGKLVRKAKRYYGSGVTVERIYVPLGSTCAVLAGCYAVGLAVENVVYSWLPWAGAFSLLVTAVLLWRFGWPMVVHAFDWVERREKQAKADGWSPLKRRRRGLVPAVIIVPVMLAALFVGTPIGMLFGIS